MYSMRFLQSLQTELFLSFLAPVHFRHGFVLILDPFSRWFDFMELCFFSLNSSLLHSYWQINKCPTLGDN